MDDAIKQTLINIAPRHPIESQYFKQHYFRYLQTLKRVADLLPGSTVVDLGTIPGHLSAACKMLGAKRVIGLDYNPNRSGFKQKLEAKGIEIIEHNLEHGQIPIPSGSADLILFTEVIEHLSANAGAVLLECRRILKPTGLLLITTPNVNNLANQIRKMLGKPILPDAKEMGPKLEQQHQHEYSSRELCTLLTNSGFLINSRKYIAGTERAIFTGNFKSALPKPLAKIYALSAWAVPALRSYLLFTAKVKL